MNVLNVRKEGKKSVLFTDFKLTALRKVFFCITAAWTLSVPMMISSIGRLSGLFLLVEIIVLSFWYIGACRKESKSHDAQVRKIIDIDKFTKISGISWVIYAVVMLVLVVINLFLHENYEFGDLYAVFVFAGDIAAPFLLFFLPAIPSCIVGAAKANTDSEEVNQSVRKKGNFFLIAFLIISFLLSYFMLFYISPMISKTSSAYFERQQYALTHDITSVTKYKNTSDIEALFESLPMSRHLDNVSFTDGVVYVSYSFDEDASETKITAVYNATAAAALLDDMEGFVFSVDSHEYFIPRDKITGLYVNFASILSDAEWRAYVRIPLKDEEYVNTTFDVLTEELTIE